MMASFNIRKLENLCRTCMKANETGLKPNATEQTSKSLISIYHDHETKDSGNVNIMELLKQTSPKLTVKSDDMLPKHICENCLDVLVYIHEFQKKTLRVEQKLRNVIKRFYSSHEIDVDPLNNDIQLNYGGEDIKIEIDEPTTDVNTSVRGFFTLIQKNGQIIEVYNDLTKCDDHRNGCSRKCDTEDAVGETELRNTEVDNLTDVAFWKYIEGAKEDQIPVMKEQINKDDRNANDEVVSPLLIYERDGKRLDKRKRTFRKSTRVLVNPKEISEKCYNPKQTSGDEDVDSVWSHHPTVAISKDMKNVAEGESLESEVSDSNEVSVEDDSDWEPPLDISERFKSFTHDSKLENNQPDNLNPKDEEIVCVKLDIRGFSCNECGKRFKTHLGLKRHMKRHLKNKQKQHSANNGHICQECGMRLKTRATYRRHLLTHEKGETKIKKRPYLCSICGKSFPFQYSLNIHSELHGTELKYQCPECPKRFRCKSNMSTHKAIVHNTVRPHVCDVCGASFKKPYCLTKHKINHGEKKHKCDYCEMKFSHPDQCRRHMRTHTGEKPYKCRYCERSYSQGGELMKHLRVHLGDNVYRCEMCPQAFRMLRELREHLISHKDDDEETKLQNLSDLKKEEERVQANVKSQKAAK